MRDLDNAFREQEEPPICGGSRSLRLQGPGSRRAAALGATYMVLEGFYGNTLQDLAYQLCDLPVNKPSLLCF